jgi:hypothetical protein
MRRREEEGGGRREEKGGRRKKEEEGGSIRRKKKEEEGGRKKKGEYLEFLGGQAKIIFLPGDHKFRSRPGKFCNFRVGYPIRSGDDHLVAWAAEG